MSATAILDRLHQLGVSVTMDGGDLLLEPGNLVPPELVGEVKACKPELVALLKGYRVKYPGPKASSKELKEILERVQREGYVLLWSTALEDLIAFYKSAADRRRIPPGFVPYSEAELNELFGDDRPSLSLDALRLIHAAKKHGGRVINRSESVDDLCEP